MVFKRYVKKRGKVFGPYYYESYRTGNTIHKKYIGGEEEYKQWITEKREKNVGQPKPRNSFFLIFFIASVILISIFVLSSDVFSKGMSLNFKFTGFAVADDVSGESSVLMVGSIENESVEIEIDTSSTDLKIKEPLKVLGEAVSENKNKRMEFETPEGNIRLYFDLLNYSEFVESVIDSGNVSVIEVYENITEVLEDLNESIVLDENMSLGNETLVNISQEPEISSNLSEENLTGIISNITANLSSNASIDIIANESGIVNGTANESEEVISNESEEVISNETISDETISEGSETPADDSEDLGGETTPVEIPPETGSETGEINSESAVSENMEENININNLIAVLFKPIKKFFLNIFGVTGKIVEENITNTSFGNEVSSSEELIVAREVDMDEVQSSAENLSSEEIEEIANQAVIAAENFEINITETPEESSKYKWGYKVKLKDLKFMAKIDITANKSIEKYNENTLKIGENLLSFADLSERGYNVKIDMPLLEMEVNLSENVIMLESSSETISVNVSENSNESAEAENEAGNASSGVDISSETSAEKVIQENIIENASENSAITDEISGITGNAVRRVSLTGKAVEENIINSSSENASEIIIEENLSEEIINPIEIINETIVSNESLINFEIPDIEYNYTISVYIERDFSAQEITNEENLSEEIITPVPEVDFEDVDGNGEISVGDIVYLDPSLTRITYSDVTDALLVNVTAEGNLTHLTIDTSSAPYNSLVLYMPFDANNDSSGKTYDYSSMHNDGNLSGNTDFNSSCYYGNCYAFDGSGDYISIDNRTENRTISISFWATHNAWGNLGGVVSLGYNFGSRNGLFVGFNNDNIRFGQCNSTDCTFIQDTIARTQGNWNYYTYTNDGTNGSLYVNGLIRTSSTTNANLVYLRYANGNRIGATHDNFYHNGKIDEVMIFNTTLTSAQIMAIYTNQSARFKSMGYQTLKSVNITEGYNRINITATFANALGSNLSARIGQWDIGLGYNNTDLNGTNGLVAYYHFDEASWNGTLGEVKDAMGISNGTRTGATTTIVYGVYNNCSNFSGASTSYVNVTQPSVLNIPNGSSARTFALWFNRKVDKGNYELMISTGNESTNGGFGVDISDTDYLGCFGWANDYYPTGPGTQPLNTWTHAACIYNGSDILLYKNGVLIGNSAKSLNTLGNKLIFGVSPISQSYPFAGSIDEVMIFNRTLTADEIKELYIRGRALWNYTGYQNLSASGTNQEFSISTKTTNILPDFRFLAGNTSTNTFYSTSLWSSAANPLGLNVVDMNYTQVPPNVTYLSLVPSPAQSDTDLNCSFNISDKNAAVIWSPLGWQYMRNSPSNVAFRDMFCDDYFCYSGDNSGYFIKVSKTNTTHVLNTTVGYRTRLSTSGLYGIDCDDYFCYMGDQNGYLTKISKTNATPIWNRTTGYTNQPGTDIMNGVDCDDYFCYIFDSSGYFFKVSKFNTTHIWNATAGYRVNATGSIFSSIYCDDYFCYTADQGSYFIKISKTNGTHVYNRTTGYINRVGGNNVYAMDCDDYFCYFGATNGYFSKISKTNATQIWNETTGYINRPLTTTAPINLMDCDDYYCYMIDGSGWVAKASKTNGTHIWNRTTGYNLMITTSTTYPGRLDCNSSYCYGGDLNGYLLRFLKDGDVLDAYQAWNKNGVLNSSYLFTNVFNGSSNSIPLNSSFLTRGDNWSCSVTPYDRKENGSSVNLSTAIINSPPIINWIDIMAPVYTNASPVGQIFYYDKDRDNSTINFNWFVNNVNVENDSIINASSGSVVFAYLNSSINTSNQLNLSVYANDTWNSSLTDNWKNIIWNGTGKSKNTVSIDLLYVGYCDDYFCYMPDNSGYFIKLSKTNGTHIWNRTTGYTNRPSATSIYGMDCDDYFCYMPDNSGYFIKLSKTNGTHIWNITSGYRNQPTTAGAYSIDCDNYFCYMTDSSGYFLKVSKTNASHVWNTTAGSSQRIASSMTPYGFDCQDQDFCFTLDSGNLFKISKINGTAIWNATTGYINRPGGNNKYDIDCDDYFCYTGDAGGYFIKVSKYNTTHIWNLTTGYINRPTTNSIYGVDCDDYFCFMIDSSGYFLKASKTNLTHIWNATTGYINRPSSTLYTFSFFYCDSYYCYSGDNSNSLYNVIKVHKTSGIVIGAGTGADTTAPAISISYPVNNSYYNSTAINVNFSVNDSNGISSCWYSNDTMNGNITLSNCANITSVIWTQGQHNVTIWTNDTANNVNSSSIMFYIDSVYPALTLSSPANNSFYNTTNVLFNASSEVGNASIIPDLDNSLVGWWRMDDINASGGIVDYKGRNNLTNTGTTAVQTDAGRFGKGMSFPADLTGYHYITSNDLKMKQNVSWGGWVKLSGECPGNSGIIGAFFSTRTGYILYTHSDEKTYCRVGNGSMDNWVMQVVSNSALTAGNWYHIICIYNGTTLSQYINGVQQTNVQTDAITDISGTNTLMLGHYYNNLATYSFNGTLDDAMVFNRSLTPAEVLSLYNATALSHSSISLSQGNHTFKAYAQDFAGNVNASSLNTFTVDTGYPTFSGNKTNLSSATPVGGIVYFNITITDANPGYYFFSWYNGTAWINDTPRTYTNNQEVNVTKTINIDIANINWTWYANDTAGNMNNSQIFGVSLSADDNIPPNVTLVSPINGSYSINRTIWFAGSFRENVALKNATLYVWNSTNVLINNSRNITITGTSNSSNLSVVLPYDDNFKWNYYVCDNANYCSWNNTNLTVTIDTVNPALNLTYPLNISYSINVSSLNYTITDANKDKCWSNSSGNVSCSGSVSSCTDLTTNVCTNFSGCSIGSCGNNPSLNCSSLNESDCIYYNTNFGVCQANYGACSGTPDCSIYDESACLAHDTLCNWNGGTLTCENDGACSYFNGDGANCGFYSGCSWYHPVSFVSCLNLGSCNSITDDVYCSVGVGCIYDLNQCAGTISSTSCNNIPISSGFCTSGETNGLCSQTTTSWSSSIVAAGTNFTNLTSREGTNTWNVYCNDSAGNINSSSVTFFKDSAYPSVAIAYPANNSYYNSTAINVNFSVSDSNGISSCWYSNDTMNGNITLSNCANITSVIWTQGQHNVTIWTNDTANNVNSSSIMFYIDSVYPIVNLTYPLNISYSINVSSLNYTITDANKDRCWWSNSSGRWNSTSVAAGTNFTNLTSREGSNTWNVYCNDSAGNINSSSVTFFKDSAYPLIDYNGTTLNDSARVWSSSIYVNVSVSETNFKNITFKLYYSNNTWINSTVFNHSAGSYAVSWTGLAGDDYKYNVSVYDLIENFNATSTRTITLIDSQSNVSLNSGWNLIALDLKDTSTGDKNISVTAGWNLIGYSSNESFDLSNAKFTNSSGTELSFSNAVSNNKLRGYMAYYDSSPSSASQRRYKYAAESSLSMDDSSFREKKGYWVYANQSGNLTLPNARGTNASRTYAWNKLRFSNGTMEKTISDAITAGWINNNLNYWDPELGWLTISDIGDKDTISSWEGVFVYSNKNNITMLRQN